MSWLTLHPETDLCIARSTGGSGTLSAAFQSHLPNKPTALFLLTQGELLSRTELTGTNNCLNYSSLRENNIIDEATG